MGQLICEVCGGNDLLKNNGVFVCQSCGAKYSLQEIKNMLSSNSSNRMLNPVSVNVDDLMRNAMTEYNAGRVDTAYDLYGIVLNAEPNNYDAIIYKALCYGWKSSLSDNRINACADEIERGLSIMRGVLSSDYDYTEHCKGFLTELIGMGKAIYNMYAKYDEETKNSVSESRTVVGRVGSSGIGHTVTGLASSLLLAATGVIGGANISSVSNDNKVKAVRSDTERTDIYNTGCGNTCIALNNIAIHILNDLETPETASSDFYQFLIDYAGEYKDFLTFESVINNHNGIVELCIQYKQTAQRYAEESAIAEARAYWKEHPKEKAELELERKNIQAKLDELLPQINEYKLNIGRQISSLTEELDKPELINEACVNQEKFVGILKEKYAQCSVFQKKQMQSLKGQIDTETQKLKNMRKAVEEERKQYKAIINHQIFNLKSESAENTREFDNLQARLKEINLRLVNAY